MQTGGNALTERKGDEGHGGRVREGKLRRSTRALATPEAGFALGEGGRPLTQTFKLPALTFLPSFKRPIFSDLRFQIPDSGF